MPKTSDTFNPYLRIGALLPAGLDAIANAAPSTVQDLVDAVVTYVSPIFYSSPSVQVTLELSSVGYHAINSYRNNLVLNGNALYNCEQAPFVQMLIGTGITTAIQPDSIIEWVWDVENNIATSDLMVADQVPLFLTTALGANAILYWQNQLSSAGTWSNLLSGNTWQDYINSLLWDVAAMNGALSAYGATPKGLIEPDVNKVGNDMVAALIGALTVTAGKVLFNWTPLVTKPLSLNSDVIAALQSNIVKNTGNTGAIHILSIGHACSDLSNCTRISRRTNVCCPDRGPSRIICSDD